MTRFLIPLVLTAAGCGRPPQFDTDAEMRRIAVEVIPLVEEAVGLSFTSAPVLAVRSREQVAEYLVNKLDEEYPPEVLEEIVQAYRAFGLIPDTLDVRDLLLRVLEEQVAGYYDPDSAALYIPDGTDPYQIRLVLAHELVHSLQGQYAPLDSLLRIRNDNDRRTAAQAVLEGQATLGSLKVILTPEQRGQLTSFWRDYRESVRAQQERMPVFAAAPYVIREELIFPYLAGADFMKWFESAFPDTVPFGARLPRSTEQILHPHAYQRGDEPVDLAFPPADDLIYQDTWGEFETRIVLREITGSESMGNAGALGWAGDRFAVYATAARPALVWWSVWDSEQAADKFARMLERFWAEARGEPGRRSTVERVVLGGRPAARLVDAPDAWRGWEAVPGVVVEDGRGR